MYYKDTNTHDYLPYDSAHPESCRKNISYNLAKRIIIVVTELEKVKLRLNKLKILLKSNKYPDYIISSAFTKLNSKVLHQNLKIISIIYFLLQPSTKIQK